MLGISLVHGVLISVIAEMPQDHGLIRGGPFDVFFGKARDGEVKRLMEQSVQTLPALAAGVYFDDGVCYPLVLNEVRMLSKAVGLSSAELAESDDGKTAEVYTASALHFAGHGGSFPEHSLYLGAEEPIGEHKPAHVGLWL